MSSPGSVARRAARSITALAAALIAVVLVADAPANAHTEIDFTVPTDGAAVGEPVAEITVAFTDPVTLVGAGFEVLDPAGDVLTPVVVTDDEQVFLLRIDPPLAGGEAAVRWEVRAEDGHTITGGFAFTVAAAPPTTTTTTTTPTTTTTTTTTTADTTAVTAAPTTVMSTAGSTATSAPDPGPSSTDPASTTPDSPPDDSGASLGLYVAIAAAIAVVAGVFLALRARTTARE